MELQGIVEQIEVKKGKTGTTFFVINVAGVKMSAFRLPEDLEEGDEVAVEYVVQGNYNNLKNIEVTRKQSSKPVTKTEMVHSDEYTQIETVKIEDDLSRFKELVNKMSKELNSFATQTHVNLVQTEGTYKFVYHAILFYKN